MAKDQFFGKKPPSSDYYSKENPFGPYAEHHRPLGNAGAEYIEGFSTKQNIAEWSARAERESMSRSKPTGGMHLREPSKQDPMRSPDSLPRDPERYSKQRTPLDRSGYRQRDKND